MGSGLWESLVVSLAPEHMENNAAIIRSEGCVCVPRNLVPELAGIEILCLYKMAFICFLSFQLLCVM